MSLKVPWKHIELIHHGLPLPQKSLFAFVTGDGMGPPAYVIYKVGAGSVDGAQGLKVNGHEGVGPLHIYYYYYY